MRIKTALFMAAVVCLSWAAHGRAANPTVEKWGMFEVTLNGPRDGNPFTNVRFTATFSCDQHEREVAGFYDGDGIYRVRFMPDKTGAWRYTTDSSHDLLDGKSGEFLVTEPSADNHGPVHVHRTFHFAYADGTPFKQIGTTCYAWTHQTDELQEQTLQTLSEGPFNKLRMCVFPKRYSWNENEPRRYPFAGSAPRNWDFSRFNPAFFQHLEKQILRSQALGIEADVILFHPYDEGHWGFDRMTAEQDDRYLRYVVSRLAAIRNVWWSLANEYDFMREKRESDWDRLFQVVRAADPYGHLRSIHNGRQFYNHTHDWVTHASIQNGSAVEDAGRAILYRDAYRKPIVFDEVKYEGDIPKRWGNISAEEMVHRFWQGTIAGAYVGHGETYLHPQDILWWSKGGVLRGQSPSRLAFLRQVLEEGPADGIETIDKWQNTQVAGQAGNYYLVYFGKQRPGEWPFELPQAELKQGMQFQADVLDTWNMTITPVEGVFTVTAKDNYIFADKDGRMISLPARPWIALRIRRLP